MTWGKWLEVANPKVMKMFMSNIPESLLPYPAEKINEAVNIYANAFEEDGQPDVAEQLRSTLPILNMFGEDKIAIDKAAERFANPEFIDTFYRRK